ncbi:MAG: ZIP family metal transporter [archaeon]
MASLLLTIIGASVIISLISLVGVFGLAVKDDILKKLLLVLIGLASGGLLGGAFFHLLPEVMGAGEIIFVYLMVGFVLFFITEKYLYWRHCHDGKCEIHTFTYMNMIGDMIHNFIDGLVIAGSFLVGTHVGWITTLAVAMHEIPQELGDFAVFVYGGFSKSKALVYNFLSALTAVAGAVFGFYLGGHVEGLTVFLLPFAAGGFIYIASSDLIPELHKEPDKKKSMISFLMFVVGLVLMWGLTLLE